MTEQELKEFFEQEERQLNVGGQKFLATHMEIMRLIEAAESGNRDCDE